MMHRSHIAPAVAAVVAEQALTRLGHRISTEEASLIGRATVEALDTAGWSITAARIGGHRLSEVAPCLWEHDLPILAGLARGRSYYEIAAETHVPAATARQRVHRLIGRVGAANGAELVSIAYRSGWMAGLAPEPRGRITLTDTEHRILSWIAEGLDNAAIAEALDIPHTSAVRQISRLYAALDATRPRADRASRCRAVALGYQHGLLPLPASLRRTPEGS